MQKTFFLSRRKPKLKINVADFQFTTCSRCGQRSTNLQKCSFCRVEFPSDQPVHKPLSPRNSKQSLTVAPKTFYSSSKEGTSRLESSNSTIAKKTMAPRRGRPPREPECLVISSDDEPDSEADEGNASMEQSSECSGVNTSLVKVSTFQEPPTKRKLLQPSDNCSKISDLTFSCRSIRVGSYKVHKTTAVKVSANGFQLKVPTVTNLLEEVQIDLQEQDLIQVFAHFQQSLNVIYLHASPNCGNIIRSKLKMSNVNVNETDVSHFDPNSENEYYKRIIFFPEKLFNSSERDYLRTVFPGPVLLQEIDQKQANEVLLVASPPTPIKKPTEPPVQTKAILQVQPSPTVVSPRNLIVIAPMTSVLILSPQTSIIVQNEQCNQSTMVTRLKAKSEPQTKQNNDTSAEPPLKLLVYPPPPQVGGITITSNDLSYLDDEMFLSDVIIDFYLKYLITEKASESIKERTYIFSSFFYSRLTQKLNYRKGDDKSQMSLQARRHAQVKKWTRNVDLFEKDFIVIPINQNSHWFVAVICFPGLVASKCLQNSENGTADTSKEKRSTDSSDVIASSSDDKSENNPLEEAKETNMDSPEKGSSDSPTKNECSAYIVIFDSLVGHNTKWRVIGILREYLTEEWRCKKKGELVFNYDNMRGYTPRVPQQENYSDCGIYLLQYIEAFLENPPTNGKLRMDMTDWFPEERVKRKRKEIRDLILDLHLKRYPNSNFAKNFTNASVSDSPSKTESSSEGS